MSAAANVSKGQTYISYKGELQTLNKQSMRHNVCPGETCHTTISEFAIFSAVEVIIDLHII